MPFASWWRGDPLPGLPQTPGLTVRRVTRWDEARQVTGLTENRVVARYADGNALYAAFLHEQPAGYGWLARQTGRIDELRLVFELPRMELYLWDFVTVPAFRGRGVYPQLLQAIIHAEDGISRFWIGLISSVFAVQAEAVSAPVTSATSKPVWRSFSAMTPPI